MRTFTHRIENHFPLISSVSRQHWVKLPHHLRTWIGQDDLFQDGVTYTKKEVMPRFRPGRAKFSTYLFISLHRFYGSYQRSLTCGKRWQTKEFVLLLLEKEKLRQRLYTDGVEGMDCLLRLYDRASPFLRRYLRDWFFNVDGPKRVVRTSCSFMIARNEFLELARLMGVTEKHCSDTLAATRIGFYTVRKTQNGCFEDSTLYSLR